MADVSASKQKLEYFRGNGVPVLDRNHYEHLPTVGKQAAKPLGIKDIVRISLYTESRESLAPGWRPQLMARGSSSSKAWQFGAYSLRVGDATCRAASIRHGDIIEDAHLHGS